MFISISCVTPHVRNYALNNYHSTFFSFRVLCKRVHKPFLPAGTPSDDGGGMNIPHEDIVVKKPLLGIYMVGWGIPMLLCGMSSAVNLPGYGGHEGDYCFLKPGPAFGFILSVALVVIISIFFLSLIVSCVANDLDSFPPIVSL